LKSVCLASADRCCELESAALQDPQPKPLNASGARGLEITLVLPLAARSRLEKVRAQADIEFRQRCQEIFAAGSSESSNDDIENALVQFVHHVFFAFAEEAVNSVSDTWAVRKTLDAYLQAITDTSFMSMHPAVHTVEHNTHRGRFHAMVRFIVTNSPIWVELQNVLIERAGLETEQAESSMEGAVRSGAPTTSTETEKPGIETERISSEPVESADQEKDRRRSLLREYKAATKEPSNKRIYEASNSGLHKPQFYEWINGTLPTDSATTINFERFLRLKKAPIPRKPHD
jgi:hypothetical protein